MQCYITAKRARGALFANGGSSAEVSIICSSMPSSHRRRPKACRLAYDTQKARRLSPLLFTNPSSHLRDQAFIRDVAWIVASKRDGLIHTDTLFVLNCGGPVVSAVWIACAMGLWLAAEQQKHGRKCDGRIRREAREERKTCSKGATLAVYSRRQHVILSFSTVVTPPSSRGALHTPSGVQRARGGTVGETTRG